jgi:nitroreductase
MELKEAIEKRESVRSFLDQEIEEDKLDSVLEAARVAPSDANRQPWKFVVVKDRSSREELEKAAYGQPYVSQAPVVIVAVATDTKTIMPCRVPAYPVDLAIAIDHMTLAAVDEGLGTCWICAFSQEKVREIIGIPDSYTAVALLPLGYPKTLRNLKHRKSIEEIVCCEEFSE